MFILLIIIIGIRTYLIFEILFKVMEMLPNFSRKALSGGTEIEPVQQLGRPAAASRTGLPLKRRRTRPTWKRRGAARSGADRSPSSPTASPPPLHVFFLFLNTMQ